ncbi:SERTA domain-containing protein 3 isoform X1 [Cynoglossus semilaevis]|uniref:SERTA domain-containing protein 3 isoform X1 n=1 Tax=Cynoglossus semilaevis TaxID=244447 RepID=UPI000497F0B3|nr:SERTA domain-containing protein 2-like isoform X1 [Cynoglossus semilaevis]XP_008307085.1 SERTA domain-containing protein 2-like isoform X1 [Cynoglossus semilaevis]
MITKGQKRKYSPEEVEATDRSNPIWESQRQFVFSVSLNKYQRGQELPEPSLRRSVLIANTLRQMSLEFCNAPAEDEVPPDSSLSGPEEVQQESPSNKIPSAKHHPAQVVTNSSSALTTCSGVSSLHSSHYAAGRNLANCQWNSSTVPLSNGDEDEEWESMSTDGDFSLSAAISSILTALDSNIEESPQAVQRTPFQSLENLSRSSEGSATWVKQGVRGFVGNLEEWDECRVRENQMEVTRSAYLTDFTVEDLFQDIDTSLLDKDKLFGLRGCGVGHPAGDDLPRYLLPISPSASSSQYLSNQNLKCLPSFSSFGPLSSSPASLPTIFSPSSSLFPGQNQGLDLEHLMEILVES